MYLPEYTYSGQFEYGQYHGKGILKIHDEVEYRGDFYNGRMEGKGKYFYSCGDLYIGIYIVLIIMCHYFKYFYT